MFKKVALAALMAATVSSNTANALTATGTFTVSATISPTCAIDTTAANYTFGTIGATGSTFQNFTPSTISINCSTGTPYTFKLASAHGSGGPQPTGFNMANSGGALLSYRLYPNLFTNAPWDATGASVNANGTGTGSAVLVNVYGEIPFQNPAGGAWTSGGYSDVVTATITY